MINIILFGPPGAGKGLQSSYLLKKYNLKHVAPGNIFREIIKQKSVLGKRLDAYMSKGNLVPEEIVIETVRETLHHATQSVPDQHFLFDGFPRSKEQAVALDKQLAAIGSRVQLFILLDVDDDTIKERLKTRRTLENRSDDDMDKVNHRLALYQYYAKRIIDHYGEEISVTIDGSGRPEEVSERIEQAIRNVLVQ